ncbi:aminopeptidase [Paenibacillus alginolyticus]|uniref:Aminopeptidase n=1 Tax=Paenibacillus alginolyticus TaxID=59839 RepID=A0ABT4GF65_9BACL|nr:aminopeptidase [Paenibacillus alginolyticus]MCY9694831.1 aminopeptidase [Paenibacillus alginolyticus]MEC0145552.1 aminopeptidase [Paenibacillus alginolyticus]
MLDPRLTKLADVLVNYSVKAKPGENILIEAYGIDSALVKEIVKKVHAAGAHPFVNVRDHVIMRQLIMNGTEAQMQTWADTDAFQMKQMQGYIGVRGGANIYELSDIPADRMKLYNSIYYQQVHFDVRIKDTRWVVLRYPTSSMAQLASMSTDEFEEFYFNVCTMDYGKMSKAMDALKELMDRTDKVRLVGPGTDLTFSIKGIGGVKCDGELNIPDGEVYSAPVRESVNGIISYNTPTPHDGFIFENIVLEFENGKIIKATANDTDRINEIFDMDEGARYVGEFAIGVNPYIQEPMKDTLFDEKIDGSFHFTPGNCYDDAYNGNKSSLHWDIVNIQRPEYGGGEIWFDDVLIRKDGIFVLPELLQLNPENLK